MEKKQMVPSLARLGAPSRPRSYDVAAQSTGSPTVGPGCITSAGVDGLRDDSRNARRFLGCKPGNGFNQLVEGMVEAAPSRETLSK